MLKTGFLRTLSDYVSETTIKNSALEKEAKAFGLMDFVVENEEVKEKFMGLFSEWLVFDQKQENFDGLTGLEYFVKYNPLKLPPEEIKAYEDMLLFEVGYFEVKKVETGSGLLIKSVTTGTEHFVHDANASLSVKEGDTLWARISSVNGLYHIVGHLFLIMPIKIMSGLRDAISKWDKNSLNAKEMAKWVENSNSNFKSAQEEKIYDTNKLSYIEAEKNFREALKKCHMDTIFTIETYKQWVTDERRYGGLFAANALFCLTLIDMEEKNFILLLKAATDFTNLIPRKFLKGKSSSQAFIESKGKERIFETNIFSKEKYVNILGKAHQFMQDGDYKNGFKKFEQTVRSLLEDRIPYVDAFRIYANAAVCCLADENLGLGEELLEGALRINSQYDFAIRIKELEIARYDDFSKVPKKDKQFAKLLRDTFKNEGIRLYKSGVFRKYEDFLKKIGVSLEFKTTTRSTIYSKKENGKKIGRNDPCFCGSDKKFKWCHGA